jgi:SAM-dependent methyltransferase
VNGEDHWTSVYRTHPHLLYETERPIFENPALTALELELADEVARSLRAKLESPVLDVACGPARHTRALLDRGERVVGLDLSHGLLLIGSRKLPGHAACPPPLVCADALCLPFGSESFRTALLLGKSFGYFSDDANRAILEQACESLAEGGFLCLEIPDREPYLATVKPVEREGRIGQGGERLESEWRSRWCAETQRLRVTERHTLVDSESALWEGAWDVRLYGRREIVELLREAGFRRGVARPYTLPTTEGAKSEVLMVGAVK